MAEITHDRLIEILRVRWDERSARNVLELSLDRAGVVKKCSYPSSDVQKLQELLSKRPDAVQVSQCLAAELALAGPEKKAAEKTA
jgi:hypothetical protein